MKNIDQYTGNVTATLGDVIIHTNIQSSLGPFKTLPSKVTYPNAIIRALERLYVEYNHAFIPLIVQNREWKSDYQYCANNNDPINWCVQIDMVGLPEAFLKLASDLPEETVMPSLRHSIFEIENSIAGYQLLQKLFPRDEKDSFFKEGFRAVLDNLRKKFGMPIALLAVTEQKYDAILATEFGKHRDGPITDEEVEKLSGFNTLFGPAQFSDYLTANGGRCGYLLYVRSSDPVDKLKKPDTVVCHPLLSNPEIRGAIKAYALTLNIDAPEMTYEGRINDTKDYMVPMGMAFPIEREEDLRSPMFDVFLETQGIDPTEVEESIPLRCKPSKGTYGCYGHVFGVLKDGEFRRELRRNLRLRKHYVVQREMPTPVITNETNGTMYTFIDRNFFGIVEGCPKFLGGFRNYIPLDSTEARMHRIHGNSSAVYAEIVC